ncbi:unnamed protein product [Phytomonas sp. Hart1]|nr:unnamed protein product [Phytomonas sp. Hart1]|eukprot:CCW66971.1 unnamed protein product [Phytomonas sp. isolate Hart1]
MIDFNCAICLDIATEPVVTRCGHLFCWGCLDHWLNNPNGILDCPVCKGRVDERIPGDIIPLYGKGKQVDQYPRPPSQRPESQDNAACTATYDIPSPTAYSFNYAEHPLTREQVHPSGVFTNNRSSSNSQSNSSYTNRASHPLPSAPRAPPPPRRTPFVHPFQYHQRGGLPLTVGSSFFFLGGSLWMTIAVGLIWGIYNFAAWRDWSTVIQNAYQRLSRLITRGADASSNVREDQGNGDNTNSRSTEVPRPSNSASFAQEGTTEGHQEHVVHLSETLIRDVVLWSIFVVILTSIIFYI